MAGALPSIASATARRRKAGVAEAPPRDLRPIAVETAAVRQATTLHWESRATRRPDLPADVLFSEAEIEVLQPTPKKRLPKPTRLGDAVRLVARLGGYIGRAKDPYPGHQIMWHGYSELQSLREGLSLRQWTSHDNKACG